MDANNWSKDSRNLKGGGLNKSALNKPDLILESLRGRRSDEILDEDLIHGESIDITKHLNLNDKEKMGDLQSINYPRNQNFIITIWQNGQVIVYKLIHIYDSESHELE